MKINLKFLAIVATVLFFAANSVWVIADKQTPIIGDDARFLQATNDLSVEIKHGDLAGFWSSWQDQFTQNTASFPRTPLFTLLSIPTFLVTGPNEDAAVVTNLAILAINSLILFGLTSSILKQEYGEKTAQKIGLIALLMFNLIPGIYGFGRLYMSEMVHILFVLLISWYLFKYKSDKRIWTYALLGLLLGLAFLERFVIVIYLVVQFSYYLVIQLKQKFGWQHYFKAALLLLIVFLAVSATWYLNNFFPYLAFARDTSSGVVAQVTSLGPVFSLTTIYRYWSVIVLWHWGWFFAIPFALTTVWLIYFNRRNLFSLKLLKDRSVILFLIPIPSLLLFTFSLSKTARYVLPALAFWVMLVALHFYIAWQKRNLLINAAIVVFFVLDFYLFTTTLLPLPHLPLTGYMPSAQHFVTSTASWDRYQFVLDYYLKNSKPLAAKRIYNLNEETEFNDAELIWFFTQRGQPIATIGEVSPQHSVDDANAKIDQADILLFETNPDVAPAYTDKYKQIRDAAALNINFASITSKDYPNNSTFYVLERISYLAESRP